MYAMSERPVNKLLSLGLPTVGGAVIVDQAYRHADKFLPIDLSKRASRIILGGSISFLASLGAGMLFPNYKKKRDEAMAFTFAGGLASIVIRESISDE